MLNYIIRRLLLLPLTLFGIVLVNFVIINLAPGEPTTITEVSAGGKRLVELTVAWLLVLMNAICKCVSILV